MGGRDARAFEGRHAYGSRDIVDNWVELAGASAAGSCAEYMQSLADLKTAKTSNLRMAKLGPIIAGSFKSFTAAANAAKQRGLIVPPHTAKLFKEFLKSYHKTANILSSVLEAHKILKDMVSLEFDALTTSAKISRPDVHWDERGALQKRLGENLDIVAKDVVDAAWSLAVSFHTFAFPVVCPETGLLRFQTDGGID
ncbi:MAG: hypothetical protein OXC93_09925 [Rhodospirillaceae bacterium]|nr:hypothetical protein [Rhodospirillaceae bacterium]